MCGTSDGLLHAVPVDIHQISHRSSGRHCVVAQTLSGRIHQPGLVRIKNN